MEITAEFEPVLELVKLLTDTFIMPSKAEDQSYEVIDKILQLMLCVLDGLHRCNHVTVLTELSIQWAPIFEMRNKWYLACYFGTQIGDILLLFS